MSATPASATASGMRALRAGAAADAPRIKPREVTRRSARSVHKIQARAATTPPKLPSANARESGCSTNCVAPTAPDVRTFSFELREAFNKAEREVENTYGHPIARRAREGVDPTVEAVYAFGDQSRYYYVEAIRPYKQMGKIGCEATAFASGWFVRENGQMRPLTLAVKLMKCDRYGASYMLPLGVMRVGDRLFWLAQFSGWDHERFVVVEIKKKIVEAVLSVWGGGCSS